MDFQIHPLQTAKVEKKRCYSCGNNFENKALPTSMYGAQWLSATAAEVPRAVHAWQDQARITEQQDFSAVGWLSSCS